jgi:hypothetical protein
MNIMRKLLLFAVVMSMSLMGLAQNVNDVRHVKKASDTRAPIDAGIFNANAPVIQHKTNQKGAVTSVAIASSANVYSYLVENQSALTANQDVNVIHLTHRANPAVIGSSSGDIIGTFSTDGGDTWERIFANPITSVFHRYPGGVIHNPTGNTNPDNAYVVAIGPSTDGSAWASMFSASYKLDSSGFDRQTLESYGTLARNGFQATTDGKFHVITSNYDDVTSNLDTIRLMEGTWDATNNKVDWVTHKLYATFVQDAAGEDQAYTWNFSNAWSNDGTIGYYWTLGRDSSNDVRSYQPIVWKTTNSGSTWTKMPVYDFSNLTVITNELRTMMGTSNKRPQFTTALDGVVDANGDLHLMAQINSAFSNNDDSLGYYFTQTFEGMSGHNTIFDVYTTSSGWAAKKLGYIFCIDMDADNTPYGDQGWDLRLQAGKTKDETKVFASWTDSDTTFAMTNATGFKLNSFPDLYVCGVDVTSGNYTEAMNATEGTAVAGDVYFHYMSDLIFANSGTYSIPVTELDLGTTDLDPVFVNYLKGVELMDADFVPNPGFGTKVQNIATVSQNMPNPFSDVTNIQVSLTKSANMSIEVISVTGKMVYQKNYGTVVAGTNNYTIDGSNLAPGVYFYTVRANDTSVTHKMIVK